MVWRGPQIESTWEGELWMAAICFSLIEELDREKLSRHCTSQCNGDLALIIDGCYFHSLCSLLFHDPVLQWNHFHPSLVLIYNQLRWYVMCFNHPTDLGQVGVPQFGDLFVRKLCFCLRGTSSLNETHASQNRSCPCPIQFYVSSKL